jgi:hypothetical protein
MQAELLLLLLLLRLAQVLACLPVQQDTPSRTCCCW